MQLQYMNVIEYFIYFVEDSQLLSYQNLIFFWKITITCPYQTLSKFVHNAYKKNLFELTFIL